MRSTLFVALLLSAPAAAQQSETSKQIDRNLADIETALKAAPAASVVTGPQSVSVGVGETVAFRLATRAVLARARRVGDEFFTATQATDAKGIDVTVTGTMAGTGHLVFIFTGQEVEVEVTVGDAAPAGKRKAIPAMPRPTPPKPGPDPPTPPPVPPDPPPPVPPDPPAPAAKLWGVVIVEETGDAVAGRGAFFADKPLADYMAARGLKFRAVDKDVVGADGKPPADVKRFLDDAKARKLPTAYIVDVKGGIVQTIPLTAATTPADLIDAFNKAGAK